MTHGLGKILVETSPCDSRRHLDEPRVPAVRPGYRICRVCLDDVETALVELPQAHDLCEELLAPARRWPRQQVSHTRTHGIELREDVVRVRTAAVGTLSSWCAHVVAARGVRAPDRPAVVQLVHFLSVHLQWLVTGPQAAEFADDVSDVHTALRSVVDPDPPPRSSLGPCPWPGCGEDLRPLPGEQDGTTSWQIGCAAGHRWPPDRWLALDLRMSDDENGQDGGTAP